MSTQFKVPKSIIKKHYPDDHHYAWLNLGGVGVFTLTKDGTNTEIRAVFLNQTKRGITLETVELTGSWIKLTLYPTEWDWQY